MPRFDYQCAACGYVDSTIRDVASRDEPSVCSLCRGASKRLPTPDYDCEGCGKPTSMSEPGFLWFFGKPYCPSCRFALQNCDND